MGVIGAWRDGGQTWLYMLHGTFAEGRVQGIAAIDGPVVAAWREPPVLSDGETFCALTRVAVGGGRASFIAEFSDGTDPSRSRGWLYVAPRDQIGHDIEPVWVFPSGFWIGNRTTAHLLLSSELLAIQMSPDGSLYTFRSGAWNTLTGRDTVSQLPQNVHVVGDQVFWEAWNGLDDVKLAQARWNEPASIWRDASPGATKGSGTDGVDLAWTQDYDRQPDGTYGRVELWTVPYQRDIENAQPRARMLRLLDVRSNEVAVGGGWWARRQLHPQRVEVFSLADGSRRTFVSPTGYVIQAPFVASAHEILYDGIGTVRFDPTLLPVDAEP